jgi:uncharacterized membrane protein YjjP (DUF1212 family)
MDSTNQKDEPLSGSSLKAKVSKVRRKRTLSKIKIYAVHFAFLALIVSILLFGNWLFALIILIMWLAILLSF